jgi:hypothetical protein
MFTFKQTINFYDDDRGFSVTYQPDDPRLSTISLWIKTTPLPDTDEMLRQLSKFSPQHEWQRQIDLLSVDTSIYQSLVGTETKVEEIDSSPAWSIDSETIKQIKSKII